MRLLPSLLSLALLSVLAAGCAGSRASAPAATAAESAATKPAEGAATAATQTVSIPVAGMHCGGCVKRITAALQAVDGVVSAETLLAEQRAVVTYSPARVAPAALTAAIRDAGYEPGEPRPQ
jgi:copper chaperone